MYCIIDMCCLCLSSSYESSQCLKDVDEDEITLYDKLVLTFPQMKIKQPCGDFKLCIKCIDIINTIYKFSKMILKNKRTYLKYRKKLSKIENRKGDFVVKLRDCFENKKFVTDNMYNLHEINVWDSLYIYNNYTKIEKEGKDEEEEEQKEIKIKPYHHITAQEFAAYVQNDRNQTPPNQNESPIAINCKQDSTIEEESIIQSKEDPYWCQNCNTSFRSASRKKMHRCKFTDFSLYFDDSDDSQEKEEEEEEEEDERVPKRLKSKSIPVHQISSKTNDAVNNNNNKHICEICKKQFKTKQGVKVHIEGVHKKGEGYNCYFCQKTFYLKYHILRHLRSVHGINNLFFCDKCNKKFTSKKELFKHILVHNKTPYTCKVCGQKFRKKEMLQSHKRFHSKSRPYACDTCGKRFSYNAALYLHKRIHSGIKPYVCGICNETFRYKFHLIKHGEKKHSGQNCSQNL